MSDENKMEDQVEKLPTYTFKWPCKKCGAQSQGQPFNFDEKTMEVTDCLFCKNIVEH